MTLGVKNINSHFLIRIVIALDYKNWHKRPRNYCKKTDIFLAGKPRPVGGELHIRRSDYG